MTDEQVDQIVKALTGPADLWSALGIPLGAALFGALLTLGLQWLSDRNRRSESKSAAKEGAARSASVLAARFAMVGGPLHPDLMRQMPELGAPVRTELLMHDETALVARWWTRQLLQVAQPPADGRLFTAEEMSSKSQVAYGVQWRMMRWAAGKIKASEFDEKFDDAFKESVRRIDNR